MRELTDIVAIDGPAGAGKSTGARHAARELGFSFLDTGAMYRAATWWALEQGIDLDDPQALAAATCAMPLDLRDEPGGLRVLVDERDISPDIRTPEVTRQIYRLDQNARVREHLVELQRAYAAGQPTVAEGRDMGTVVFPHAKCKIFLDASIDERARRRADEMTGKGLAVNLEALRKEIHERDEQSRNRQVSPLRKADDAVLLDTTHMTLDEVVAAIVKMARQRL